MIIVIDNYDSFTYNLVDYIGRITNTPIKVYRNDKVTPDKIKEVSPSHIVISPGPKTPTEAGISKAIIQELGPSIPIIGVCLGHQSIGEVYGATVINAKHLMHGKTSSIQFTEHPLFNDMPNPFIATRYHSLVLDPNTIDSSKLTVLAQSTDDNEIMAVAHTTHPIYGVQFHPESICSPEGIQLLKNFLVLKN